MRTNWWIGTSPLTMARSSIVTWPAIWMPLARMTSFPITQSWAMCTYVMMKQRWPIAVRPVAEVPRLMVQYSRMMVPSPISTQVSSPLYLRSCGSLPMTVPYPIFTPDPTRVFRSITTCAAMPVRSPTVTCGPTIAYGPTVTSAPRWAVGSTIAVRWIIGRSRWPPFRPPPRPARRRRPCPSYGRCARGTAASPARSGSGPPAARGGGTSRCPAT